MNILIAYSKNHFDPEKPSKQQRHWASSASILARSLYSSLQDLGAVTYVDASSVDLEEISKQKFDLFIGIQARFKEIAKACSAKKSIYFAVNMHPSERVRLFDNFTDTNNIPTDAISAYDKLDVNEITESLNFADYILCVGNISTYNSYIRNGIPKSKIKMLNYGVGKTEKKPAASRKNATNFLYVASDIGIRKGFDIINNLFTELYNRDQPFHLDIVGSPNLPIYKNMLKKLVKKLGSKATYHGWVDSDSDEYRNIILNNHYVVSPALEEGQAGAVLDAMRYGTIPILSHNTGIDFSPLGTLNLECDSSDNLKVLFDAIECKDKNLKELRDKTIQYYSEFHQDFLPKLISCVVDCLEGNLYPKVSIILPIFNKENTIIPLLKYLERSVREYGNCEIHIIFDGCKDNTEEVVKKYFSRNPPFNVTYETTPDIFEVKTNNMGLRKSTGKYCVIVQDDNFIYDKNIFFEVVNFLDKNPSIPILGCLAGVNFYPRGTKLKGQGQIGINDNEVYWRQDEKTDPALKHKYFQVDACMRGPLVLRKDFLEEHGYLDESYAPFYMDDMDIAFRAAKLGYKTYAMLSNVENKSYTVAAYDEKRNSFWEKVMKKNSNTFYERWQPSTDKQRYLQTERVEIDSLGESVPDFFKPHLGIYGKAKQRLVAVKYFRRIFNTEFCKGFSNHQWQHRMAWVRSQASAVPKGSVVLDIGAGAAPYKDAFSHTNYVTQDFCQTPDFAYGKIDIVSDITEVPLPDNYADVILCTEVFEHIPHPIEALKEISRLLKPGGKLIFSAPLGSGQHQPPYHFYGGYTRFWYEKFFPECDLSIVSLEPNGGLFAHIIEMLWRSNEHVVGPFRNGGILFRIIGGVLQVSMYNLPTLVLDRFEKKKVVEDFTVCFFCVAKKET